MFFGYFYCSVKTTYKQGCPKGPGGTTPSALWYIDMRMFVQRRGPCWLKHRANTTVNSVFFSFFLWFYCFWIVLKLKSKALFITITVKTAFDCHYKMCLVLTLWGARGGAHVLAGQQWRKGCDLVYWPIAGLLSLRTAAARSAWPEKDLDVLRNAAESPEDSGLRKRQRMRNTEINTKVQTESNKQTKKKETEKAVQAANLWRSSQHTITCCSLATPLCRLIKPVQGPRWPSKQQTFTHLQTDKTTACLCLSSTMDQHTYAANTVISGLKPTCQLTVFSNISVHEIQNVKLLCLCNTVQVFQSVWKR